MFTERDVLNIHISSHSPDPYFLFLTTNTGQRRGPLHYHPPDQPCCALPCPIRRVRRVQLLDSYACRRVLNEGEMKS